MVLGLNHAEVARKIGVHRSTLYRWETGATQPHYGDLCVWANVLGLDVSLTPAEVPA